jgi:hypothetical protein
MVQQLWKEEDDLMWVEERGNGLHLTEKLTPPHQIPALPSNSTLERLKK